MRVLQTERLSLRWLTLEDAPFVFELVNEPSWLHFIGDKNVRNLEDARHYLRTGPLDMYSRLGFGMFMLELTDGALPLGMCGLLKRDTLPEVDVGYALSPQHWGKGYASEAVAAVLDYGHRTHGLRRVLAITSQDNDSSVRVLEKVGMKYQQLLQLGDKDPVKLFAREFDAA